MAQSVLRMQGITKVFNNVPALSGVDLELARGEVHALVGENGSGKSTLIKIMTGAYTRDAGTITLEDRQVDFHSPEDAQDLTQGFFARVLEKNYFAQADRQKGKFRSFLLVALKHFLSKERERTQRAKRGGRYRFVSWDESEAEERYEAGTSHELTAQRVFERSWAMTLLEKVFEDLRQEYAAIGKSRLFEALQPSLAGEQESGALTRVASDLNMSKGAARMAVLRLRRRYAQLLRFEIAHTVRRPEQIDNEIRCLFDAWN